MDDSKLNLENIRTDYHRFELNESEIGEDPFQLFEQWMRQAEEAKLTEVNAMTLCTVDDAGMPHGRIVLLKGLSEEGFVFYTNYESNKGKQIQKHNKVALLFFWKELERQVRIEGKIEKVAPELSDRYFHSRPKGSQIGALASPQSQMIDSRETLEKKMDDLTLQYEREEQIPRPEHWGGYLVRPFLFEFWQGRANRLHDRIVFDKKIDSGWKIHRLAP